MSRFPSKNWTFAIPRSSVAVATSVATWSPRNEEFRARHVPRDRRRLVVGTARDDGHRRALAPERHIKGIDQRRVVALAADDTVREPFARVDGVIRRSAVQHVAPLPPLIVARPPST